jgi:hypothetical protein
MIPSVSNRAEVKNKSRLARIVPEKLLSFPRHPHQVSVGSVLKPCLQVHEKLSAVPYTTVDARSSAQRLR